MNSASDWCRYSPLGRGFLTGDIRSVEHLADDDFRKSNPRFTGDNLQQNLRIVDEVEAVAKEAEATAAQVAIAWLLAQGDDIAPIPGTKRVARVEENTAADAVTLTTDQLSPAHGDPAPGGRPLPGLVAQPLTPGPEPADAGPPRPAPADQL